MVQVSIILPTRNRLKSLTLTLDSLFTSLNDFNNWELFIIDNCSSDGTFKYCKEKYGDNSRVRILSNKIPSAYISRNMGIQNSAGEYLIFLEDDLIIPFDWFLKVNNLIRMNPEVGVFTLSIRSRGRFSNILTLIQEYEKERLLSEGKNTGCIPASSLLIKRQIFTKLGLFREIKRGGDIELTKRLLINNENIKIVRDVFFFHEFARGFKDFVKRSFAYGYSFNDVKGIYNGNKESFAGNVIKNIKMPFIWAKMAPNRYFSAILLSFVHEAAFIIGGICHKKILKKIRLFEVE